MAGYRNSTTFFDDFFGGDVFAAAGQGSPWAKAQTAAGGSPTFATVTGSQCGELKLQLAATSEVENLCLYFNDILCFNIDAIQRVAMRVKFGAAAMTSGSAVVFGLGSARNDTLNSVTNSAWFRVEGATSTTNIYCETVDGTNTLRTKSSGQAISTSYKEFVIDFTGGKSNVKFLIEGAGQVAKATTFDMSNLTGSLQPIVQLQKTASTNVDAFTIDYIAVDLKR